MVSSSKQKEERLQLAQETGCQCTEEHTKEGATRKHKAKCIRPVMFLHIGTEEFLCATCNQHYDPTNERGKTWVCSINDPYYLYNCNTAEVDEQGQPDHRGCSHG